MDPVATLKHAHATYYLRRNRPDPCDRRDAITEECQSHPVGADTLDELLAVLDVATGPDATSADAKHESQVCPDCASGKTVIAPCGCPRRAPADATASHPIAPGTVVSIDAPDDEGSIYGDPIGTVVRHSAALAAYFVRFEWPLRQSVWYREARVTVATPEQLASWEQMRREVQEDAAAFNAERPVSPGNQGANPAHNARKATGDQRGHVIRGGSEG